MGPTGLPVRTFLWLGLALQPLKPHKRVINNTRSLFFNNNFSCNTNNTPHKKTALPNSFLDRICLYCKWRPREQPRSSHPVPILRCRSAFIRLYSYYTQAIQSLFAHAVDFFTLFALYIIPTVSTIYHAELQARLQEKQTHGADRCAKCKRCWRSSSEWWLSRSAGTIVWK
jgi:hypothetical protein